MRKNTPKQTAAARTNGARSKGPVTPAGKRKCAINSLRHGLLAKCTVLHNESREHFDALLQHHLTRFNPIDDIEHNTIEEMVGANWRLRRLWAIETRLLDLGIAQNNAVDELTRITETFRDLADSAPLQLIDRYTTRLSRMYQRALNNFYRFRADRPRVPGDSHDQTNPASDNCLPFPSLTDEMNPGTPSLLLPRAS